MIKGRIRTEISLRCLGLVWLISSESSSGEKVEVKFLTDIVFRLCSSRTREKVGGKESEIKKSVCVRGGLVTFIRHFSRISFI